MINYQAFIYTLVSYQDIKHLLRKKPKYAPNNYLLFIYIIINKNYFLLKQQYLPHIRFVYPMFDARSSFVYPNQFRIFFGLEFAVFHINKADNYLIILSSSKIKKCKKTVDYLCGVVRELLGIVRKNVLFYEQVQKKGRTTLGERERIVISLSTLPFSKILLIYFAIHSFLYNKLCNSINKIYISNLILRNTDIDRVLRNYTVFYFVKK